MSTRSQLINFINSNITQNSTQSVTGLKMNQILIDFANSFLVPDTDFPLLPSKGGTGVGNSDSETITLGGAMSTGGTVTIGSSLSTTGTFSSGGNFSTSSTVSITGAMSVGGDANNGSGFHAGRGICNYHNIYRDKQFNTPIRNRHACRAWH